MANIDFEHLLGKIHSSRETLAEAYDETRLVLETLSLRSDDLTWPEIHTCVQAVLIQLRDLERKIKNLKEE